MKTETCCSVALKPTFQPGMESCIIARSRDCMPQAGMAIATFPRRVVVPTPRQFWHYIACPFLMAERIRLLTYLRPAVFAIPAHQCCCRKAVD